MQTCFFNSYKLMYVLIIALCYNILVVFIRVIYMKKITNVILIVLLSISSVISVFSCSVKFPIEVNNEIKNIIILIGDGMGQNHIHNAKTYFELDNQKRRGNLQDQKTPSVSVDEITKQIMDDGISIHHIVTPPH